MPVPYFHARSLLGRCECKQFLYGVRLLPSSNEANFSVLQSLRSHSHCGGLVLSTAITSIFHIHIHIGIDNPPNYQAFHTPASITKPYPPTKMSTSLPEISPSLPRQPLSPLSISSNSAPRPLTPSANHAGAKNAPLPRIVRRKPSLRAIRHPHLDSSESTQSVHSSLYDASLQASSPDDAAAVSRTWDVPPSIVTVTTSPVRSHSFPSSTLGMPNDEITLNSPSARAERAFSAPALNNTLNNTLHTPHVLEPITERPSNTTLRTSISSRRRASFSLPNPQTPLFTSSTHTVPRFPVPPRSPHRTLLSPDELAAIVDVPAPAPHLPLQPPPPRIPTPPGLPTFNSPAAMSYRLPAPPMRRRDLFRPATPKLLEWRAQTAKLPRGVVMRGDGGVMVRGRFRWAGGDAGDKSRHPWNQPADADANANPDSTAGYVSRLRRSTGHGPQNDMAGVARRPVGGESRPAGGRLMSGIGDDGNVGGGRMGSGGGREGGRRGRAWDRVWERGCWVCCGAERGEEEGGENAGNVIVMDVRGGAGRR